MTINTSDILVFDLKNKSLEILIETVDEFKKALPFLTVPIYKEHIEASLKEIYFHINEIKKPNILVHDYNLIKTKMERNKEVIKWFLELNYNYRELIRVSEFLKRISTPCLFRGNFITAINRIENNSIDPKDIQSLDTLIIQGIDFIHEYGTEDQKNSLNAIREAEESSLVRIYKRKGELLTDKQKQEIKKQNEKVLRKHNVSEHQIMKINKEIKKKEKLIDKLRKIKRSHNTTKVNELIDTIVDHKGFLSSREYSNIKEQIKQMA